MSILTHYGGSVLAMCGKSSVVLISDKRLGNGNITVGSINRITTLNNNTMLGQAGFIPDNQRIVNILKKNINLYNLNEGRNMQEEVVDMLSYILYEKRFTPYYTQPVIAGRNKENKYYVASMDCVGCIDSSNSFMAAGTASNNLMGLAENLYREDMDEEDLVVTAVQVFINAVDRDCLSGSGIDCYIMNNHGIERKYIQCRMD
ncbi:20S proteasome component beta 3 [Spraguea lophii 42_110]|uniref:20S proteasome component beta 3 n=1 Tax=Spraguea lophii (strain 42_110) TaxID=1358809 RepID=S7XIR1_SPRLO|nr:20S proteasome component beta 3 [Spraguea lophii 42_110]